MSTVPSQPRIAFVLVMLGLTASCGDSRKPATGAVATLPPAAQCVLKNAAQTLGSQPELTIGGPSYTRSHQPDAPGPLETPIPNPGPQPAGACRGNTGYRFGTGLYDTTGPIGGDNTGHADLAGMVLPPQPQNGIHTRLFARAFAIASPCNGKRVLFVSDDHAFSTALLRQEVLKAIAADPTLSAHYGSDNLMLSATHTHGAPGGFGDPPILPSLPNGTPQPLVDVFNYVQSPIISTSPFDQVNFDVMVGGIVQAIRRAHANLEAHAETAPIQLSIGELLNANRSRDPPAYQQNSPAERAKYLDRNGHEIQVDKRFLQLSFVRGNGSAAGVLNWFGVHPTVMGNHALLISSDSKGHASLSFERLMATRYQPDGGEAPSGADNFVAGFAQTDEGNSVPDLYVFDKDLDGKDGPGQGVPYRYRHGTDDPYDFDQPGFALGMPKATAISGDKQLAQALRQFAQGRALSGPVDYRFFYVDMNAVTISDPVIDAQLAHADLPAALYPADKATCSSGVGLGKFVGGANAPDFGAAGFTCLDTAPVPYLDQNRNHFNGLYNGTNELTIYKNGLPVSVPFNGVATYTAAVPLLCAAQSFRSEFGCQQEKPVLTGFSDEPAPFQIFRVGNLAILGLPWEVTTMAARRLRQTVLDALSPVGVDTVVIAGLANAYLDYMATREEYTAQQYEGASTEYGPWQLAAAQQESRRLALTLVNGQPAPTGPTPPAIALGDDSPITTDLPADFGAVQTDALERYRQRDLVDVSFTAGYPGNDLKTMSSYLYVERQNAAGGWDVIATDKDPELLFVWNSNPDPASTVAHLNTASSTQALWTIPANAPTGTYRIRHEGVSRSSASEPPTPYEGVSRSFRIEGAPAACPD